MFSARMDCAVQLSQVPATEHARLHGEPQSQLARPKLLRRRSPKHPLRLRKQRRQAAVARAVAGAEESQAAATAKALADTKESAEKALTEAVRQACFEEKEKVQKGVAEREQELCREHDAAVEDWKRRHIEAVQASKANQRDLEQSIADKVNKPQARVRTLEKLLGRESVPYPACVW